MEHRNFLTRGVVVALLALFCCMLWGSAFPCIKIGYELFEITDGSSGTYILFAGLRFFIAGILALIIGSVLQKKVLIPKKDSWGMVVKLSACQTSIQYFFFYLALANTSGVSSAIISSSNTFFALIIASLIYRMEKLSPQKIAGCIIGFIGVVAINLGGGTTGMGFKWNGEGLLLIAMISSGFSSNLARIYGQKEDPVTLSSWQFTVGGLILMIIGLLMGGKLEVWNAEGVALLFYLGFVSAAAYSVWGILLKFNSVSRVLIWGFCTPIFGVLLSALLLGERNQAFTLRGLFALVMVSIGIAIVNTAKDKDRAAD